MTRPPLVSVSAAERALEPLALRPRDAAYVLGVSERLLWDWTRNEGVPHVRIGNVVLYPVESLRRWLASRAAKADDREATA
jgi:predicted DNA-binding transcriptional regulator AlpA